jgi:hypothetical protein
MMKQLNPVILLSIAIALNIALAGIAPVSAFETTISGNTVSVTGTASPGEQVSLRSSFTMNLPVSGGQYEYEANVEIPQEPNRFSVTARNVQDFNAGVKMGIWITKRFQANGGTASISHADVPPGRYSLKMFGEALPGSDTVPVEVVAETRVKADAKGKYSLDFDTSGVPAGEYRIEAAGDAKTIQIGGSSQGTSITPSATSTSSTASQKDDGSTGNEILPEQKAKQVGITSETVHWYANETGRTIATPGEYQETEKQLRQRLSGGYWKIIPRGEALTEQAGNCENEFCMVRDKDACTVCRDKDILQKSNQPPETTNPATEKQIQASQNLFESQKLNESQNRNESQTSKHANEKGMMEKISDWAMQLFGTRTGDGEGL